MFVNGTVNYGNFSVLDHAPIVFNNNDSITGAKCLFLFCNAWTTVPKVMSIVRDVWQQCFQGSRLYRISQSVN